jgi:hypothetical protein
MADAPAGVVVDHERAVAGEAGGLLKEGGLDHRDAGVFATTLVAGSEGAVVMSRAEDGTEGFDIVAGQLLDQVRGLMRRER